MIFSMGYKSYSCFVLVSEVYTSSECSENSDYSSPEETLIEDADPMRDQIADEANDGEDETSISNETQEAAANALGPPMS